MMKIKAGLISLCAVSVYGTSPAYASKVDINVTAGYTSDSDFSSSQISNFPTLQGYNIGVKALVPYDLTDMIKPVVGGGLEYETVRGSNLQNGTILYTSYFVEGNAGAKFNFMPISAYALLNGGYGFNDKMSLSTPGSPELTVSNHYYVGITAGGLYEIMPMVDVGLQIVYNAHTMTIAPAGSSSFDTTFNEQSMSIVGRYSL